MSSVISFQFICDGKENINRDYLNRFVYRYFVMPIVSQNFRSAAGV